LAHTFLSLKSLEKGIGKLELNKSAIDQDLENNWAVIAEAIQTVLRKENYPNPYEALKSLTRKNDRVTKKDFEEFIDTLNVSATVKVKLQAITPFTYTGI
jgi:adenylosuccinate lyase